MKNPDKNKKIFKRITADNLYRPKRLTLRNYNRFISPFIDRYNWGHYTSEEEKRFRYSADDIQTMPYKSYIRLREQPRHGYYRDIALSDHLNARKDPEGFVFYTSNPFSNLCLLEGDIDPIPNYGFEECLEACYYIRNQYHPNTYWEPSTTGAGIHFYTIIDFSTFPSDPIKYDVFHRQNCNRIIELYSGLLSKIIDSMYYCSFDKFCGSYPIYNYPYSSFLFQSRGSLAKLPCPQSNHDFSVLVNTPVLSFLDIGKNWDSLQELLQDNNHSTTPPRPADPGSYPLYPYNILGRDFDYLCKNDAYMYDNNSAFIRVRHSIQKLSRELGRIPGYDEWNAYYEKNECNTGEEDIQRRNRFEVVSKYVEKTFDPSKIGSLYHYGDYLDSLFNDISHDDIDRIVKEHTKYRFKITHQDLDIGLGAHWLAVRTHMEHGKQLSVPRNTIPALFKSLKDKGIIKRSCDLGKSKAIRVVLEQMGYLKLVDPYFSWKKGDHISQRWAMDVKFPKYNDYKLFCGDSEKMAMDIKKMRDEGKGDLVKSSNYLPEVYREMFEVPRKYGSREIGDNM